MVLLILDVISTHFPDLFDFVVNISQGGRDPKRPRLSIADICNDTPMQGTDDVPVQGTDDTPMQGTDDTPKRDPDDTPMENSDDTSRQDRDKTPTQDSYDESKQILEDEEKINKILDSLGENLTEEASSETNKLKDKHDWTHNNAEDEVDDMQISIARYANNIKDGIDLQKKGRKAQAKLEAWKKMPEGPEKEEFAEQLDNIIDTSDRQLQHTDFIHKQTVREFEEHKRKAKILLDREKSNIGEFNKHVMENLGIDNEKDLYKLMAKQLIADNPDINKKPEELAEELSVAASTKAGQNTALQVSSKPSSSNEPKLAKRPSDTSSNTPSYTGKGKKRVYDYDSPVDKSSSSKRNSSNESLEFISYKSAEFDLFNFNLPDYNLADNNLSDYDLDYEMLNEFPFFSVCVLICIFLFRPLRFIRTKLLYIIATVVLLVFVLLFLIIIFI